MLERITARADDGVLKAVYRAGGVYAKVYATPQARPFGSIGWMVTGSHCDETGAALKIAGAAKLHDTPLQVVIYSDSPADLSADLAAGMETVAARVITAAQNEMLAQDGAALLTRTT